MPQWLNDLVRTGGPPKLFQVSIPDVVSHPERLCCNGQAWIYGGRGREKRGIDNEKILDVMGPAVWIQNRRLRVSAEAQGSALMGRVLALV